MIKKKWAHSIANIIAVCGLLVSGAVWAVDTDLDTLPDDWEIANGRDPNKADYAYAQSAARSCLIDEEGAKCGADTPASLLDKSLHPYAVSVGDTWSCVCHDGGSTCWGTGYPETPVCSAAQSDSERAIIETTACYQQPYNYDRTLSCSVAANKLSCWATQFMVSSCNFGGSGDIVTTGDIASVSVTPTTACALTTRGIECATPPLLANSYGQWPPYGTIYASIMPEVNIDPDGDGILSDVDVTPLVPDDTDGDGITNDFDPDDDNDTVLDGADNCLLSSNLDQLNTDGDALGNICDNDDDNDGVADTTDSFPFDATRSAGNTNILYTFSGDSVGDNFGYSVSGAGDVNNDRYTDVIVGTFYDDNNGTDSGSTRVLSGVDGSILYDFNGDSASDWFGYSVSAAGDVNNDGYADVIVGAIGDNNIGDYNYGNSSGSARVMSGVDGSILYTFNGDSAGDNFGISVSATGDVNNDGYADVIVGAWLDDNNGSNSGLARVFSGANGAVLYTFNGDNADDYFGFSVSTAGDVNNDGYADVIVGAYQDDNNGTDSGSARVFSGVDGSILYTFNGDSANDRFGYSVSAAGDVNNDGYPDVIVGAYQDDNNGSNSGSTRVLNGVDGSILYAFNGDSANDRFGYSVSAAGDVNNDGYPDVIVGSTWDDNNGGNSGSARVLSGKGLWTDADGDGLNDAVDPDDDNDGTLDINDLTPRGNAIDTDGDGIINDFDFDDDNDDVLDADDFFPLDPLRWLSFHLPNDHNKDLISDIFWRNPATGEDRVWLLSNTAGKAADINAGVTISNSYAVAGFGDVDRDGDSDVILRSAGGGIVVETVEAGNVSGASFLGSTAPEFTVLDVADTDGDIDDDIVLYNSTTGQVLVWVMDAGIRTGVNNLGYAPLRFTPVGMGDIDNNNDEDILFVDNTVGEFAAWKLADNTKQAGVGLGFLNVRFDVVDIADADNDGDVDIYTVDPTNKEHLVIKLQDGNRVGGTYGGTWIGYQNARFTLIGIGDYLGDGDADLFYRDATNGEHAVIQLENGIRLGGNWGGTWIGFLATRWSPLNIADYDGDGDDDIFSRDMSTGEAIIYKSNNGTASAISALGVMGTGFVPYFEN